MLYVPWIIITVSKFQIFSPSVPWFPRSVAVFLLLILWFQQFLTLWFSCYNFRARLNRSAHTAASTKWNEAVQTQALPCCKFSLCLHGHHMDIGVPKIGAVAVSGRWTFLSLLSKGGWCKKGGIWVTSSTERGHRKTCRLQTHQDPAQKRLNCTASVQIEVDGMLWAAVIIIAEAEEDCWAVSWLTCGCLQLVFTLQPWCSRRKADPSKMGYGC